MPGLPQAIVDDPKARLYGRPVGVSRSGHAEALEVQRKGCLPLRLWYWTSDNTFSRQAPHFYWARFSWILSRLQSKRRSSRDLPKVRAEDRLLAVASKSHSTEVIPTIRWWDAETGMLQTLLDGPFWAKTSRPKMATICAKNALEQCGWEEGDECQHAPCCKESISNWMTLVWK